MSTVLPTKNTFQAIETDQSVGYVYSAPIVALIALRILTSWSWINGAFFGGDAKISSDFLSGHFLIQRINGPHGFAASSLYPWIGHFVSSSVTAAPGFWAWIIFLGEAVAAVSFLLGLFTRLGGIAAVLSAVMDIMVAGGNGADTIGQNYLLLVLAVVFLVIGAGRWFGLDGWLQTKYPNSKWLRVLG